MRIPKYRTGLVMVTALGILLALSSVSFLRLNALISEVGTSRFYRIDALSSQFTMGGADAALGMAVENPMAFTGYLQGHNFRMSGAVISPYFTTLKGDTTSVFAPDNYTTSFQLVTSAPEDAGGIPGFEMGKYCMEKYFVTVTGTLRNSNSSSQFIRTMRGVVLIGPMLCE